MTACVARRFVDRSLLVDLSASLRRRGHPRTPEVDWKQLRAVAKGRRSCSSRSDTRGSQVEIVQNIGRALQLNKDGSTKVARIIKGGLGKGPERAAKRAQQLTAIDEDWNCPWPLDWLRHYRVLADLVDADGVLPYIAPGVVFEGDDLGKWLQRQRNPGTWTQLSTEQQQRPVEAGRTAQPDAHTRPCDQPRGGRKPGKAQQAFQRGLAALTQWVEREGAGRPVRRGHSEGISVKGGTEPVVVKLGVFGSPTPNPEGTGWTPTTSPPSPHWA